MKRKDYHPSKRSEEEKKNVRNGNARNIKEKNVTVVDYFVLPIDIDLNELASPFGIIFTFSGFGVI